MESKKKVEEIIFDKYGNITPYELIEIDLKMFKSFFVEKMENSEHRMKLFENYLKYTFELQKLISSPFFQWINGSFVTKKNTPKDIDLVSFIDFRLIEGNENKLKNFFYPLSKKIYNVDAYIVKVYPKGNRNIIFSKSDTLYWFHNFQKTKLNKRGKKNYKGFIKIDLNNEKI